MSLFLFVKIIGIMANCKRITFVLNLLATVGEGESLIPGGCLSS